MSHHHHQQQQEPPKRRHRPGGGWSIIGTMAATAVVVYGTYRFVDYMIGNNPRNLGKDKKDEQQEQDKDDEEEEEGEGEYLKLPSIQSWWRQASDAIGSSSLPFLFQQQQDHSSSSRTKLQYWKERRQRIMKCRQETTKLICHLLPGLQKVIEEETNTSKETKELKQLRAHRSQSTTTITATNDEKKGGEKSDAKRQEELWEVLKVNAVTRLIATAYAHTILFLVLTTQVHLLGGKLWEFQQQQQQQQQQQTNQNAMANIRHDRMDTYQASHHRAVLNDTYHYFLEKGLRSLIQTIKRAVSHSMQEMSIADPSSLHISREMIEDIMKEIRMILLYGTMTTTPSMRGPLLRKRPPRNIFRFVIPPDDWIMTTDDADADNAAATESDGDMPVQTTNEIARLMLEESGDIIESPVMEDAQHECLDVTFDWMRDEGWGLLYHVVPSMPHETDHDGTDQDETGATDNQEGESFEITQPLAKVIAQLKQTANLFYPQNNKNKDHEDEDDVEDTSGTVTTSLLVALEKLPTVVELGDVSFHWMHHQKS